MSKIIECIPNFSEGKEPKTIEKILQTIQSIPKIKILNHSMDPDHNRSVITFVGEVNSVLEAAFQMTKTASNLIDMTKQQGVHPRIGATDVIPLVPIKNITAKQLIPLSHKLAKRITAKLNIPTYLYEQSALQKPLSNLAEVRKGGFENPLHTPDFGHKPFPKAGATAIGVRNFLIAYNINLQSQDLQIAKKIASQIREKNGGLKSLKAIGLHLKSQNKVQISMNLTNYQQTNIDKAFDTIKTLAAQQNIQIAESELIGLIPEDAYNNMKHHNILLPYPLKERLLKLDF